MTQKEMQDRSGHKLKQVMDLATVLHLRVEAKQRINEQGFIENVVFWHDDEKYPAAPEAPAAPARGTVGPEAGAEAEDAPVASPFKEGEEPAA